MGKRGMKNLMSRGSVKRGQSFDISILHFASFPRLLRREAGLTPLFGFVLSMIWIRTDTRVSSGKKGAGVESRQPTCKRDQVSTFNVFGRMLNIQVLFRWFGAEHALFYMIPVFTGSGAGDQIMKFLNIFIRTGL